MKHATVLCALALAAMLPAVYADTIITPEEPTLSVADNPITDPDEPENRAKPSAGSSLAALVDSISLSALVPTGMDTAAALEVTQQQNGPEVAYVTNTTTAKGRYFSGGGPLPVLTFILGGAYNNVNSIVVWNYFAQGKGNGTNTNGTKEFSLAFFSDEAATRQIGSTVTGLTLAAASDPQQAEQVFFGDDGRLKFDGVKAIQMTLTDNHGGNRVGLGEVRFSQTAP